MTDERGKNIYTETFGQMCVSEEIRRKILNIPSENEAGEKSAFGASGVRRRFSAAMVCCLILVLITGTAVAVSSAGGLGDWFESLWEAGNGEEMTVEQMGVISSLTTPLNLKQTVDGVTATLDSIAYSDGSFWMLVNVDGMKFDKEQHNAFDNYTMKAYSESGTELTGGWSVSTQTTENGETVQVLIDGSLDSALLKKEPESKISFEMLLGDLTENPFHAEESRLLKAGEWSFEFEISQETMGRILTADSCEISTRDTDGQKISCTVSELELNAVNISFHIKPGENCTDERVHQETPRIILRGGHEVGISGGSGSRMADGCWGMEYQLAMPIDVDEVKAVKIGETEIPLR